MKDGALSTMDLGSLALGIISGDFDEDLAEEMIVRLSDGKSNIDDVLTIVQAFRDASIPIPTSFEVIGDLCGTGGAGFRTFNVSTISSFVAAAAGMPIAKHGNRSYRGRCGSADLMEALGARISLSPSQASSLLDEIGFVFLYAPDLHPAMKNVAPLRKKIGRRTVFNMMGPLLNPVATIRRQLLGVYDEDLLDMVPQILDRLGSDRAMVVHGHPGMDEVSTLGPTKVAFLKDGCIDRFTILPKEFGIEPPIGSAVVELPPIDAAKAALEVLSGRQGARRDMVLMNTSAALLAFGRVTGLEDGFRLAENAIDSGRARRLMERYVHQSNRFQEA